MESIINKTFKEKNIIFNITKDNKNNLFSSYIIDSIDKIRIVVLIHKIELKTVVIYQNANIIFHSILFDHYSQMLDSIDGIVSYIQTPGLNIKQVNIEYLLVLLSHQSLKNNQFAQSLAKTLIERHKLSDKQLMYVIGPTPNGRTPMYVEVLNSCNIFVEYASYIIKNNINRTSSKIVNRTFNILPTQGKDVQLVPTIEHTLYQYNFINFNPVQSLLFPYIKNDCNIVIGANTSAGKTICAEMLMDYVLSKNQKIIYLSPLKSLTQEKYDDWKIRFPTYNINIMTGDYSLSDTQISKLNTTNIVCMTSEMLDSRTRKFTSEKNIWLYNVGLVIVDESHIIGSTNRGDSCETGVMRFTQINSDARIMLLSATMPNVSEFSEWLTILNNKKTETVYCNWRPVVLNMNFIEYNTTGDYYDNREAKISEVVRIVESKPNEKFLVFVHDKVTGKEVIKSLKDEGIYALFHNADLNIKKRLEIETQFRIKNGGLRVMVSTSTLAWGSVKEDTLITKSNGNKVKACVLQIGDEILSYNEQTKEIEQDIIFQNQEYHPKDEYVITLEDGSELVVDAKHPVYVYRDGIVEIEASELQINDDIVHIQDFTI